MRTGRGWRSAWAAQRLRHRVGTNGFFVALTVDARVIGDAKLAAWWSEEQCGRWSDDIVRPDGRGEWHEHGRELEFLLEYDLGTEPLGWLAAKLPGYEELESERGVAAWILFAFLSERRERNARAAMSGATVPVATASLATRLRPSQEIWLPLEP